MANNSPSRTVLVAGVIVALASLLVLNSVYQRLDPKYQEQLERERQQEEAKKAAEKQKNQPTPAAPSGAGNELVALGDDATLGNKDGNPKVTIGFQWTPQVQGNPGLVYGAVESARKLMPNASIRVVNSDLHPEVTPGITVNGNKVASPSADGGLAFGPGAMSGGGAAGATPAPMSTSAPPSPKP